MIGVSGSGKTTLSRFVAWLNGLTVFQVYFDSTESTRVTKSDLNQFLTQLTQVS